MKLRQQSITVALIGLLVGLAGGWYYADYYNRQGSPIPTGASTTPDSGQLPPGHPQIQPVSQEELNAATQRAEDNPTDFEAQTAAGKLLYQASRYDEAAKYYQRAHQVRPDDYDTLVQLGNTHFDLGLSEAQQNDIEHSSKHFVDAASWYERALEKNPDDVNVRTDYGLTFYYRRPSDLEKAITQYKRSLQVQVDHPQTLANLVTALAEKGDLGEAEATLGALEQKAPGTPLLAQTLYNYTRVLMNRDKWAEAKTTLAKLEKIVPGDPVIEQLTKDIDAQRKSEPIQPH